MLDGRASAFSSVCVANLNCRFTVPGYQHALDPRVRWFVWIKRQNNPSSRWQDDHVTHHCELVQHIQEWRYVTPAWRIRPLFRVISGVARANSSRNDHCLPSKALGVTTRLLPRPLRLCMILGQHFFAFTTSQKGWQGTHLLECRRKQTSPRRARRTTAGALLGRDQ